MKNNKKEKQMNVVKYGNTVLFVTLLFLLIILGRGAQLALASTIDGVNLKNFASKRTTQTEIIQASRGTIYDSKGVALAQNASSYTLIAYLNADRTTNPNNPQHVIDKELTATKLSEVIGIPYETAISLLNKDVYQTEFGKYGKGLTEIQKDDILALGLPGIDFIESQKRTYPLDSLLSYTLGYTLVENDSIVGKMGLERQYNDILTGTDGYVTYQKDLKGYKIAGTDEYRVEAISGKDVYLTINSRVQLFVEDALKKASENYTFDSMNVIVAEAQTGKILAIATTPTFNPNNPGSIVQHLDPNISIPIEPGSTMKIYSYMAAMENGFYNGEETFKSGIFTTTDGTEIGDWDRKGWGVISYDRGFALSSNTGVVTLVSKYMDAEILRSYYQKLGFGQKTGISLPMEASGGLDFTYETEIYNAAFGQKVKTTAIQNIQALTSISNNGVLLKPYLIDKIVDPNTGEVIETFEKTELGRVASQDTVNKIKELMRSVVTEGTGAGYYLEGYDIIAKTGTAQIASTNGTGYIDGASIRGFAGMYPGENPEIIIYATATNPAGTSNPLTDVITEIVTNISTILEIAPTEDVPVDKITTVKLDSYLNENVNTITEQLQNKGIEVIVLGDGNKVINQYPTANTQILTSERVYLITSDNILMPDVTNYSRKEIITLCNILNIKYTITGYGYAISQNILPNTKITNDLTLEVVLSKENLIT